MWEQTKVSVVSRVISVMLPDLQELTPIHSHDREDVTETRKQVCIHLKLPSVSRSRVGVPSGESCCNDMTKLPVFSFTWGFVYECIV